jgi:hypothetical protein
MEIEAQLSLFNAVLEKKSWQSKPFINFNNGLIIMPNALYAKVEIERYYSTLLSAAELNKTFHKSWDKVANASDVQLLIEQLIHYVSTYGTNFNGETYIPDEILNIKDCHVKFYVINAISKEQMEDKCFNLLGGIALSETTLNNIFTIFNDLSTDLKKRIDEVKNKEAMCRICHEFGILPKDNISMLRYMVYESTNSTLLIKSKGAIEKIKNTPYNPESDMLDFGLVKLSEIFNRYKPLFLAWKKKCPRTINKIGKLSKKHHVPMQESDLMVLSTKGLTKKSLENANIFQLVKGLNFIEDKLMAGINPDTDKVPHVYTIRNGKAYIKSAPLTELDGQKRNLLDFNRRMILSCISKMETGCKGKKIYVPSDVDYAFPTSEKMFVGGIPYLTTFFSESLTFGIYWRNAWGARDMDLSATNPYEQISWCQLYHNEDKSVLFSGDMTNAPDGAVEYITANKLTEPLLIVNTVFSGNDNSKYNIILAKGSNRSYDYMMSPENLYVSAPVQMKSRAEIIGVAFPYTVDDYGNVCPSFTLYNAAIGKNNVWSNKKISGIGCDAILNKIISRTKLVYIMQLLGATFVDNEEDADVVLTPNLISKDKIIELISPVK